MSKASTKPPSGTRDFLPQDIARRRYVVSIVSEVYETYGFAPLETPAFENLATLLGKYGDEGDQLLFRLLHRRDALARALDSDVVTEADLADLGLRYDLTVPLARVVAQYRDLPRFFKRYQIQPVWRADRPGRGRYREFFQCDVDITGTESLMADAEVCAAVAQVLRRLGFSDFTLRINHRRLLQALIETAGIEAASEQTALVALDKLDKLGEEGVLAELAARGIGAQQARRLLDLLTVPLVGGERDRLAEMRRRVQTSAAGGAALDQLDELWQLLESTPAFEHARFSPELARGLTYYTGPIFEINVADLAGSLGGGGRYDELVGMFSKQPVPSTGCSLGLERILLVMAEREMYPPLAVGPSVMLCWMDVPQQAVLGVAARLRAQGLRVEVYPQRAKLGKQLQYADSPGVKAPVAAILGSDELADDNITLKELVAGQQLCLPIDNVAQQVLEWRQRQS